MIGIFYAVGRSGSAVLKRVREAVAAWLDRYIQLKYKPFLQRCIEFRYITITTFLAMLILMMGLLSGGFVRWVFFPYVPCVFFQANIHM